MGIVRDKKTGKPVINWCRAGLKKGRGTGAIPLVEETFRDKNGEEHTCYHGSFRANASETISVYVHEPDGSYETKKGEKEIRYYLSITSFKSKLSK